MNPLFEGAKANDSKDLVNFIIMTLHDELNEGTKFEDKNAPPQENELLILNYFKKSYYQENKSIICDLFYGINDTKYTCGSCNTNKYNYQISFFYIFPLEEIRKFKIQNLKQIYKQNMQYQMNMNVQMGQLMPYMNNMQNLEMMCSHTL